MECKFAMQIFLSTVISLALCGQSLAVTVDNLYTVVIQVTDNTIATRNQQLPKAFAQVVKKAASSHNVLNHPEYEAARQHLDRFVSNYFYTDNGNGKYTLTLRFNEQMIQNLLNKIGRANLGKNRPQVLLWLVVDQQNAPRFITHGPQEELATKIDALSSNYGLPIILPLVDLTERLFISEQDVLNFNLPPLQRAAERYNTNTMLLGKIHNIGGTWYCEWRLVDGTHNIVWNTNSKNLDEELELMINQLADQLIVNNTRVQNLPTKVARLGVAVRVKGVKSVADYAKVLEHLKRLDAVQKVEVGSVDGNQAIFLVTANGGMDAILKALKLSNMLTMEFDSVHSMQGDSIDLIYKVGS